MKLLCKLFGHKFCVETRLNRYVYRCKRCKQHEVAIGVEGVSV